MAFSNCNRFLIAAAVSDESILAVFDVNTGNIHKDNSQRILVDESVNKIIVNPHSEKDIIFATVGQRGSFSLWTFD